MRLELNLKGHGLRLEERLELTPGQGMVVLGAARNDNTTLLRSLAGFEPGQLLIDGQPAAKPPKRHFALCADEPQLLPQMTVEENLRLSASDDSDKEWQELLRMLTLEPLLSRYPDELTPLQAHSAVLARAALNQPKLLLIDEPLLEPRDFERYIDRLVALLPSLPFPVISACRRPDHAARLGGHWLYLVGGEARALGDATELLLRADLPLLEEGEGGAFRLPVVVAGHNPLLRSSHLDFRGGRLRVPLCHCKVGRKVTAVVPLAGARFSTTAPTPEAGLSGIAVTITQLTARANNQVLLELDADGTRLWLLLPQRVVDHQGLAPGKRGFALYQAARIAA